VSRPVEYLDLDDLVLLASMLFGDPPPIRDVGLLGASAARPATTVGGTDAYPDVWRKAAALLDSVVRNHALVDGNKRLGWLATATFLEINDVPATAIGNDDVYALVMRVADEHPALDEVAMALEMLTEPARRR
jgi:death-on-curing protein